GGHRVPRRRKEYRQSRLSSGCPCMIRLPMAKLGHALFLSATTFRLQFVHLANGNLLLPVLLQIRDGGMEFMAVAGDFSCAFSPNWRHLLCFSSSVASSSSISCRV